MTDLNRPSAEYVAQVNGWPIIIDDQIGPHPTPPKEDTYFVIVEALATTTIYLFTITGCTIWSPDTDHNQLALVKEAVETQGFNWYVSSELDCEGKRVRRCGVVKNGHGLGIKSKWYNGQYAENHAVLDCVEAVKG